MTSFRRPLPIWVAITAIFALSLSSAAQEPNPLRSRPMDRVRGAIDGRDRVIRRGNLHPMARPEYDAGAASPDTRLERMILVLQPDVAQQQALDKLIVAQHDPSSPLYRQWLTPEEFGEKFGVSKGDLERVRAWLESQGFEVEPASAGRRILLFSGSSSQVESAFHTAIHRFVTRGERHLANATDPQVPLALADVVAGVASLHDFRASPQHVSNAADGGAVPAFTSGGTHYLGPADFATIYNLGPLYSAGNSGSGQSIAVVARTNINPGDVPGFRSFFGLPANPPVVVLNGPDPGIVSMGEAIEASLDTQWAGAVARDATVKLVISASTQSSDGVALSAQYIVNNNVAPVVTVSFGLCEAAYGSAGNQFWSALWQQAAAQGMTVLVSSGDSGAAGCDGGGSYVATGGLGVNALCSSPYSTCVGGTQFNDDASPSSYWSAANSSSGNGSALAYIPEKVWNESGISGGSGLWAGGGGVSSFYAQPAWQAGLGLEASSGRAVPDVSLSSAMHDGYVICVNGQYYVVGGTSAAAPAFAGIAALAVQATGGPLGSMNPALYGFAARQATGGPAVFHDIVAGSNSVPGLPGFSAGSGYDPATGLGSVDAHELVSHWNDTAGPQPTFTFAAAPATLVLHQGSSSAVAATVTPVNGFNSTVTVRTDSLPTGLTSSLPALGGPALPGQPLTISFTAAKTLRLGSYSVTLTAMSGSLTQSATIPLSVQGPCTYTLSKSSLSVTAAGGNAAVNVNTATACGWTATTSAAWITFVTGTGSGSGAMTFAAAQNTGNARSATVTVAGKILTITQAAAPPVFSLAATSASFPSTGGSGSVAVTATPSSAAWTAVSNVSWIRITANARSTGSRTVSYMVSGNTVATPRTGVITIAGIKYTVTQALACVYKVTAGRTSVPVSGTSGTTTVTAPAGCGWTSSSSAPWLTIVSGLSGSGNGSLVWQAAANTTGRARSATLTVAKTKVTITQSLK